MSFVEGLIEDTQLNAAFSWALIAVLGLLSINNFLMGDRIFGGFGLFIILISVIPAFTFRNPKAMIPWEILCLAALPFLAETFIAGFPSRYFSYLSAASVAMITVVELDLFTKLRMNHFFAVLLVTLTTIASAGVWALVRWLSDIYLGTNFALQHDPLMWEFVMATLSGLVAGFAFDLYFKRFVTFEVFEEVAQ